MKATGFLQIVPRFGRKGELLGIRFARATTTQPRDPQAGALTIRLEMDVPDAVFKPVSVKIVVPVEIVSAVTAKASAVAVPS